MKKWTAHFLAFGSEKQIICVKLRFTESDDKVLSLVVCVKRCLGRSRGEKSELCYYHQIVALIKM